MLLLSKIKLKKISPSTKKKRDLEGEKKRLQKTSVTLFFLKINDFITCTAGE